MSGSPAMGVRATLASKGGLWDRVTCVLRNPLLPLQSWGEEAGFCCVTPPLSLYVSETLSPIL